MKSGIRAWSMVAVFGLPSLALAADGLSVRGDVWPTWQARLTVTAPAAGPGAEMHGRAVTASVLGDYYFSLPRLLTLSREGGLRATSGVIASGGLRVRQAWSSAIDPGETQPYLGLGYTHAAIDGGWGLSADVGLVAASASRLGRVSLGSGASLDDAVRELKLSPMVQLSVRYTF